MVEIVRLFAANARAALSREEGQTLVEYSLIIVSVSLLCIAVLTGIGHTVTGMVNNVAAGL
jgi:Flp pilus assembly pilin Flp